MRRIGRGSDVERADVDPNVDQPDVDEPDMDEPDMDQREEQRDLEQPDPEQPDPADDAVAGPADEGTVDETATAFWRGQHAGPAPGESPDDVYSAEQPFRRRSVWYVLRKSGRELVDDQGTDVAATLTYYAVLAIFPAAVAVLSVFGVVGQADKAVDAVLDVLRPLVSTGVLDDVQNPLTHLAASDAASIGLVVGVLGALWSASAYVAAFGRAMNRVYEVEEGRPFWRLRPMQLVVTLVSVVLCAAALAILVVSGPVTDALGDKLDLGQDTRDIWEIAKWPALALIVIALVAVLYHFTPNVRLPKFRVLSVGAFVAIVVWVVASAGFAVYVVNFSSYDHTYGSVGGVIVALVWLWLTNLALLFGAELDSELERARELHRGLPAEEQLQLPVRSERGIRRRQARREKDWAAGRAIRESRVGGGDPGDRPY
jgi:membrane protein